jgi:hypothetical protein
MTGRLQSVISDYLYKRRISGGYDFAVDASKSLANLGELDAWDQESISAALSKVRTDVFRANPNVTKSEVIEGLAKKLAKQTSPGLKDEPRAMDKKCRILFLAANPLTTGRLQIDEELRSVRQKIEAAEFRDDVTLEIGVAVRPDDILQLLNRHDPHVLHFSGHGSATDGIALSGEAGDVKFLSEEAIERLFVAMSGRIRLVVLNACSTEDQAKAIGNHIDCVVGMSRSISDDAAALFAASLYRALAFGKSIQNAFEQALAAIALEGLGEADTPRLFVRAGVSADEITLMP